MNIERIFFPGIHCGSRSRGMPSKLLPHEISNWTKSGISEMEKLFSMRETLFSFFTVSLFVVALGSDVNKYYLAIMISSQLFSLIKKQSLDIIFVDCWLSLTISRSYLCVERYLEKKRTSEITMMKMQVKKMLRRCFLGVLPIPSVWYFHFHYEGQARTPFSQSNYISDTRQTNLKQGKISMSLITNYDIRAVSQNSHSGDVY